MKKYIVIVQSKTAKIEDRLVIAVLEKETVGTKKEALFLKRNFKKSYPKNKIIIFKHLLGNTWREI